MSISRNLSANEAKHAYREILTPFERESDYPLLLKISDFTKDPEEDPENIASTKLIKDARGKIARQISLNSPLIANALSGELIGGERPSDMLSWSQPAIHVFALLHEAKHAMDAGKAKGGDAEKAMDIVVWENNRALYKERHLNIKVEAECDLFAAKNTPSTLLSVYRMLGYGDVTIGDCEEAVRLVLTQNSHRKLSEGKPFRVSLSLDDTYEDVVRAYEAKAAIDAPICYDFTTDGMPDGKYINDAVGRLLDSVWKDANSPWHKVAEYLSGKVRAGDAKGARVALCRLTTLEVPESSDGYPYLHEYLSENFDLNGFMPGFIEKAGASDKRKGRKVGYRERTKSGASAKTVIRNIFRGAKKAFGDNSNDKDYGE